MHITLYIRKDLEDRFKAEEDKSRLVNELLEKHYGVQRIYVTGKTEGKVRQNIQKMGQPPDDWEGPLLRDKKKGKL